MKDMWWEEALNGEVPDDSIICGHSSTGEKLYVGRGYVDGDLVPGKIHPSHGVCYLGNNGNEQAVQTYEVLVGKDSDKFEWVAATEGTVPSGAVVGGKIQSSGEEVFVARGVLPIDPTGLHGGKLVSSHGCVYIAFGGTEHSITEYEVLCEKSSCTIL